MRPFEDFLRTLTEGEIKKITDSAQQAMEEYRKEVEVKDKTYMGTQVGIMCMKMSLDLLEHYHEWLLPQIPEK